MGCRFDLFKDLSTANDKKVYSLLADTPKITLASSPSKESMVARIIYFGTDECRRLLVLRSAGFAVDECPTLAILRFALEKEDEPAAVIVAEPRRRGPTEAVSLIREHTRAPLILFQNMVQSYSESDFDLVVPVLTYPGEWMYTLCALINRSRAGSADQFPQMPRVHVQPHRPVLVFRHKA